MTADRHLDWDGCFNVRDLGGLATIDGRPIRRGAVVRGDRMDHLTADGWNALVSHGVRTIVDLRHPHERAPDAAPRPAQLTTVEIALEDLADTAFWDEWRSRSGTPLYYRAFLQHAAQRMAVVLATIAEAKPGGVLVHCGAGRDRTGLVTLVLLALHGVSPDDIADDYALSAERLRARFTHEGRPDEDHGAQEQLREAGTTARAVILATLAELDAPAYLQAAGLSPEQIAALRSRLLDGPSGESAP
ncbi:MAG: tyrosine-protein phosphatase [Chloroflexota bacterium]